MLCVLSKMNDLNMNYRKEVTSMMVTKESDSVHNPKSTNLPILFTYEYLKIPAKKEDMYRTYIEKMGDLSDGLFNVSTSILKHNFVSLCNFTTL